MMKHEYPLGLTLGEFRKLTAEHPDNAEIFVTATDNSFYSTERVVLSPLHNPCSPALPIPGNPTETETNHTTMSQLTITIVHQADDRFIAAITAIAEALAQGKVGVSIPPALLQPASTPEENVSNAAVVLPNWQMANCPSCPRRRLNPRSPPAPPRWPILRNSGPNAVI
jgi:hypothetical protein